MEGNNSFIFKGKNEFRNDLIKVAQMKEEVIKLDKVLDEMTPADINSIYFQNIARKKINLERDINNFFLKCIGTLTIYYNERKVRDLFIKTGLKEDFNAIKFAGFFCGTFFGLFLAFLYNL